MKNISSHEPNFIFKLKVNNIRTKLIKYFEIDDKSIFFHIKMDLLEDY